MPSLARLLIYTVSLIPKPYLKQLVYHSGRVRQFFSIFLFNSSSSIFLLTKSTVHLEQRYIHFYCFPRGGTSLSFFFFNIFCFFCFCFFFFFFFFCFFNLQISFRQIFPFSLFYFISFLFSAFPFSYFPFIFLSLFISSQR